MFGELMEMFFDTVFSSRFHTVHRYYTGLDDAYMIKYQITSEGKIEQSSGVALYHKEDDSWIRLRTYYHNERGQLECTGGHDNSCVEAHQLSFIDQILCTPSRLAALYVQGKLQ
jgi:hypothetical protein